MQPRLGTANRNTMGTRQGTAGKLGAGGNVAAYIPEVMPNERLQTGMRTVPTAQGGSTRVNYDKAYYISKVREKYTALTKEIDQLRKRSEATQKDQLVFQKQEARHEELTKEVRGLEGDLADLNLALDKLRLNTRPEEINFANQHVRAQNEKRRAQLDLIYMQRKKLEDQIQGINAQLQEIHQMRELRLNELGPVQRQEYSALVVEDGEIQKETARRKGIVEELNLRLAQAETRLKMDSQKLKGKLLKDQIAELEEKKGNLQIQLNESNLSEPEARQKILNKIKEENGNITAADKRIKEIKNTVASYEKRVRELEADLAGKKTDEDDKKKFEVLYQKEKEMDEFLNEFESLRETVLEELAKAETQAQSLLEENSKILEVSGQLASKEVLNSLGLNRKKATTVEQARLEYDVRFQTVKGLESAESRVKGEIKQLEERLQSMRAEVSGKFQRADDFCRQIEKEKQEVVKQTETLKSQKDGVAEEAGKKAYDTEIKEKKLKNHDKYGEYSRKEKQLRESEAQKYYLRHNINTKNKEMKYSDQKTECLALLAEAGAALSK